MFIRATDLWRTWSSIYIGQGKVAKFLNLSSVVSSTQQRNCFVQSSLFHYVRRAVLILCGKTTHAATGESRAKIWSRSEFDSQDTSVQMKTSISSSLAISLSLAHLSFARPFIHRHIWRLCCDRRWTFWPRLYDTATRDVCISAKKPGHPAFKDSDCHSTSYAIEATHLKTSELCTIVNNFCVILFYWIRYDPCRSNSIITSLHNSIN